FQFSWEHEQEARSIAEANDPRHERPSRPGFTITTSIVTSTAVQDRGGMPPRGAFREYHIEYANADGDVSERDIYMLTVDAADADLFTAWCYAAGAIRTFRASRVIMARHLQSGRAIKNLVQHYRQSS